MVITEIIERGDSEFGLILPMDIKIQQGIRIVDSVQPGQEEKIIERINDGYNASLADKSKEYGVCLAYAINPEEMTIDSIDIVIRRTISQYPFGSLSFSADRSDEMIASGRINTKDIHILRFLG